MLKVCSTDGVVRNVHDGSFVVQLEGCFINQQPIEDAFAVSADGAVFAINMMQHGEELPSTSHTRGPFMRRKIDDISVQLEKAQVSSRKHYDELSATLHAEAFAGISAWSLQTGHQLWRNCQHITRLYTMTCEASFVALGRAGLMKISAHTGITLAEFDLRGNKNHAATPRSEIADKCQLTEDYAICAAIGPADTQHEDYVFVVSFGGNCILLSPELEPLRWYQADTHQLQAASSRVSLLMSATARFANDGCRVQLHVGKHFASRPGEQIITLIDESTAVEARQGLLSVPQSQSQSSRMGPDASAEMIYRVEQRCVVYDMWNLMAPCIGWDVLPPVLTPVMHAADCLIVSYCTNSEGQFAAQLVSTDWSRRANITLPEDAAFVWAATAKGDCAGRLESGFEHVSASHMQDHTSSKTCAELGPLMSPVMGWTSRVPVRYKLWGRAMYLNKDLNV